MTNTLKQKIGIGLLALGIGLISIPFFDKYSESISYRYRDKSVEHGVKYYNYQKEYNQYNKNKYLSKEKYDQNMEIMESCKVYGDREIKLCRAYNKAADKWKNRRLLPKIVDAYERLENSIEAFDIGVVDKN